MNWQTVRRWLSPPTFADPEKNRQAWLLHIVLWLVTGLLGAMLGLYNLQLPNYPAVWLSSSLGLMVCALGFWLNRRGRPHLAASLLIGITLVLSTGTAWGAGGLLSTGMLGYAIALILASLFLPWPGVGLVLALILGLLNFMYWAHLGQWMPPSTDPLAVRWISYNWLYLIIGSLLILATRAYHQAWQATQQQATQLRANNAALRTARVALEREAALRTRDVDVLHEFSRVLAETTAPAHLLNQTTRFFCDKFALHHVSFYDYVPARRALRARFTASRTEASALAEMVAPLAVNALALQALHTQHEVLLLGNAPADPLWPQPHWQIALPVQLAGQALGVLDLHSAQPNLAANDLALLTTLLTLIALAYENGVLLQIANETRFELANQARRLTRQGWDDYLNAIDRGETVGQAFDGQQLQALERAHAPHDTQPTTYPIEIAGAPIGAIELYVAPTHHWLPTETAFVETVARQVAQRVENLRLLAQAEAARTAAEQANQRLTAQGWAAWQQTAVTPGFAYEPLAGQVMPLAARPPATPTTPLQVHGTPVGVMGFLEATSPSPAAQTWLALVAESLGTHVDNLRLTAQAQVAQTEAERQSRTLQTILDHLPVGVLVVDPAGQPQIVNPIGQQLLGPQFSATITAHNFATAYNIFLPGTTQPAAAADLPLVRALQTQVPQRDELEIQPADGVRLTVDAIAAPIFDAAGQLTSVVALFQDITSRKAATAALAASEARYRQAITAANAVPYTLDYATQRYSFMGEAILQLTGYPAAEMTPALFEQCILEIVRHTAAEAETSVLAPHTNALHHGKADLRIQTPTGEERWLSDASIQIPGPTGQPVAAIGILQDITERKRNEALLARRATEIEETNRFLDLIIENLPILLFIKDAADLRFLRWNKAGETIFGFTRQAVLGRRDQELFSPEQADFFEHSDQEALQTGQLVELAEEPVSTAEGQRWLRIRKLPILDAHGQPRYLLGLAEDITEQKVAEQRNRVLNRLARQLNTTQSAHAAAQTLMNAAQSLLGWHAGYVALCNEAGTHIHYALQVDTLEGHITDLTHTALETLPLSAMMERAINDGPQLLNRTPATLTSLTIARPLGSSRPSASLMYVPIHYGTQLLGVLSVQSYTPAAYDLAALALCQTLADYVAGPLNRLRVEEDLRVRNRAIEASTFPIIITDMMQAGAPVVYVNPAFETQTGYAAPEVLGRNLRFLRGPETTQPGLAELRAALRENRSCTVELRNYRKDGSLFWNELTISPVPDATGRVTHYVGFENDITARKMAETALRHQKEQFEKLVAVAQATAADPTLDATLQNTLAVAVALTDAERGSVFLLNPAGEVTHGLLARGGPVQPEHHALLAKVMHQGLAGWVYRERQAVLVPDTAADSRWVALPDAPYVIHAALVVPIFLGQRVLGVLSLGHPTPGHFTPDELRLLRAAADQMGLALRNAQFSDEQRLLAAQLRQAKEAAETASQAKSAFLATMSHELRTPLTVIIGYTELLLEDAQEASLTAMATRLQKVESSARHLLTLINEVLDYSKIEAGKLELNTEVVELAELLPEVVATAQILANRQDNHLSIQIPPAAQLGSMTVDATRFRQILLNLLSNASKFTHAGQIQLHVTTTPTQVQLMIADTGIGMTPEQLAKLFQPFTQVDSSATRKYGGTGLGLVITRQLCQLMGGNLALTSTLHHGTTATVTLPRHAPTQPEL